MTGLSYDAALAHVLETNPTFIVEDAQVRGVSFKTFPNVPKTLRDLLIASRDAHADPTADYLVCGERRWTYDAFCADVKRTTFALKTKFGVQTGTRVGLATRNSAEMLILMMGIVSAGGVIVFLNAWWTTPELDYALKDSGARIVFADAERLDRLSPLIKARGLVTQSLNADAFQGFLHGAPGEAWPETPIDTDDDFAIMYSSGTTGEPKGVVLTHRGAVHAVYSWLLQAVMQPLITPEDPDSPPVLRPCVLIVTPLFHVTATHPMFLLSIPAGAKVVVMKRWDADQAVTLIEQEQVSRFLGVPTQSADLLLASRKMGKDLASLNFLGAGGAKRPPAQVLELAEDFPPAALATGWGMTETNAIGIGVTGEDYVARPGVAGKLYPPLQELRFLDDQGRDVPDGEIGEITVKSACNMRCYLNKPDATAEVLRDGWLRTGDLGQIDPDGFVTILDRKKSIIIRGGENIACLDVEAALHRHPAVAEACAFPVPHTRLGEVVGAAVQLRPDRSVTAAEVQDRLSAEIAHFKVPEHIWFFSDALPRGATDKLDRRGIRDACVATLKEGGSHV
jgi:acyl-CoA synthetase (AMP-forming)/AMP-acid ligase II